MSRGPNSNKAVETSFDGVPVDLARLDYPSFCEPRLVRAPCLLVWLRSLSRSLHLQRPCNANEFGKLRTMTAAIFAETVEC